MSAEASSLAELGEEEVVKRLLTRLAPGKQVLVGPGDDCAVIDDGAADWLLLKTDAVVSGIHFLPETEANRVGWKAVARVLSDFAAMGGWGSELLVTIALPGDYAIAWVEQLYDGMGRCATAHDCAIVGGETVGLPPGAAALISIAGSGRVRPGQCLTRDRGRAGEGLWVTGVLGGSFPSGHHLDFHPRVREGRWLAQHSPASAMMDLSDGLRRDLPRLAKASRCGFTLAREKLPRREGASIEAALGDGEDMELLFSATDGEWVAAFQSEFPMTPLTRIGELVDGGEQELGPGGWQHFTGAKA